MRYVIIDTADLSIINMIEYEEPPTNPPPGFPLGIIAVQHDTADFSWTCDGKQLLPPAPQPTPPVTVVTPVQGRIALLNAGLLDQAKAAVDAAGGATAIWWEYATIWERDNTLLNGLSATLGLSSAQVDQLFKLAAAIK